MRSLAPCPSCHRHVESEETACPFCQMALVPVKDSSVCQGPCSGHASPRLGRAAMMAVGAALLCASCLPSGTAAYGAAIVPDAGGQTGGAGGQTTDGGGQTAGAGGQTADASTDGAAK
jgi:hypothetical protein